MQLRSLIHGLWITGISFQVLLAMVLILRRTWVKFPVFAAYTFFNLLGAAVAYAVSSNGMLYFFTYWISEAISTILGLAVVYELFKALFSPHPALRKLASAVFGGAIVLLIVLGLIVICTQSPNEKTNIGSAVMIAAEAARVVEVGLFMFLFLFSSAFGLRWREHVFGIALGLGTFAAVDLANLTLRSELGSGFANALNLMLMVTFNMSLLLWTFYLLNPESVPKNAEMPERAQLEQWNQAVMELISR